MDLKKGAVVLNGFIHDFATGYWLAALIVIKLLHNAHSRYAEAATVLNHLEQVFFWNMSASVLVILATGGIRGFTYVDNVYGSDTESVRKKMLIRKHVFLFVLFFVGGWAAYRMSFH